jgi:sulfatase modifying factor 1
MLLSVLSPLTPFAMFLAGIFGSPGEGSAAPSACPDGMRLVEGDHEGRIDYQCSALKWGMCAGYTPGFNPASGTRTHERVCMDEYEAPNVKGQKPLVMLTASEGVAWCAARGKRLCTEFEWELACEGPQRLPYGYGWSVDGTCNQEKPWRAPNAMILIHGTPEESQREVDRLWQGEPSGARPGCETAYGIKDMVGNVEEWVKGDRDARKPPVLMGGHWAKSWSQCRDTNFAHVTDPAFTYYEVGLRCCEDAR